MTKATAKKTLTVIQTGSVTAQKKAALDALRGLGLGKPRSSRVLEDTPSVRGLIEKAKHLVKVENGKKA